MDASAEREVTMFRARLGVGSVAVALSLLLSLAGNVAAASSYQTTVQQSVCTRNGGAYGRGYVLLNVKAIEVGSSQTNYFKVRSRIQVSTGIDWSSGGTWQVRTSSHFADNSSSNSFVVTRRHDFKAGDWMGFRIQMKVQFWSAAAGLLTTRTVNSKGC